MEIILGSCLLAALVSGVVTIITSKKQNELQYITAERRAWREEIRKIAHRIQNPDKRDGKEESIGDVLVDLKVRLNAYGFKGTKSCEDVDYKKDEHIWEAINDIEKNVNLKKNKELLILYLSVLLKHDWERAKQEVNGVWINFFKHCAMIMSILCYFRVFNLYLYNNCQEFMKGYFWVVFIVWGMILGFEMVVSILPKKILFTIHKEKIETRYICFVVIQFVFILGVLICICNSKRIQVNYIELCMTLIVGLFLCSVFLTSILYLIKMNKKIDDEYCRAVNEVNNLYGL